MLYYILILYYSCQQYCILRVTRHIENCFILAWYKKNTGEFLAPGWQCVCSLANFRGRNYTADLLSPNARDQLDACHTKGPHMSDSHLFNKQYKHRGTAEITEVEVIRSNVANIRITRLNNLTKKVLWLIDGDWSVFRDTPRAQFM